MHNGVIAGRTHTLHGSGDKTVHDLHVRVEERHAIGSDGHLYAYIHLLSAWFPTPDELERLNKGAPIILDMMERRAPPPVALSVGDVPEDDNPYLGATDDSGTTGGPAPRGGEGTDGAQPRPRRGDDSEGVAGD